MKILFFLQGLRGGGAERTTATLANYWADRGHVVTVVTLDPVDLDHFPLRPSIGRISLELSSVSASAWQAVVANWRRILALRKVLHTVKPDVALGMLSNASIILAFAAVGLPGIRIGSERTYPPQLPLGRAWELLRRFAYGWLDHLVVQTGVVRDWAQAHTRARSIVVIPNAVVYPLEVHQPIRDPSAIGGARYRLISVGRLGEEKRHAMLLEVFAEIAPQFPDWELVIVGEGRERPQLQAILKATGLEGQAFLAGEVGNLGAWYESADLQVLNSRFEGFPNALCEGLAYGVPAVSADCLAGPRDIIRENVDGLLVPSGDRVALATALTSLMADAARRTAFAERAVEVRQRFAPQRVVRLWEALFPAAEQR